jgi:hypothetical protein
MESSADVFESHDNTLSWNTNLGVNSSGAQRKYRSMSDLSTPMEGLQGPYSV